MKLDFLLNSLDKSNQEKNIAPCPGCGVNPAVDCGYGHWDYWGEFDCLAPATEDISCEDCPHILCSSCREQKTEPSNK